MHKTFAMAEVKAAESENPNGEFEVILSAETLDRDGEVIDAKAFDPLPDSIPFHAFHDFHDPIGRAVPVYEDGVLKARGVFASTARAQEIRTLVAEGVIGHTSVGFMAASRKDVEGTTHITGAELLEGSFVSVPSNREAAVLMAKGYEQAATAPQAAEKVAPTDPNTSAPATPADEKLAGKSLASEAVGPVARLYADALLAGIDAD